MLDASVITSYLLKQANLDDIHDVMRWTLDHGHRLFTVDLAYFEVANALWRACNLRGLIEAEAVHGSLESLYRLPLEPLRQEADLISRSMELSLESGLSVYDSVYVSAAERERAAIFTLDEKQRRVAENYVHVRTV